MFKTVRQRSDLDDVNWTSTDWHHTNWQNYRMTSYLGVVASLMLDQIPVSEISLFLKLKL